MSEVYAKYTTEYRFQYGAIFNMLTVLVELAKFLTDLTLRLALTPVFALSAFVAAGGHRAGGDAHDCVYCVASVINHLHLLDKSTFLA